MDPIQSSWPCKAEQIVALTDEWQTLQQLPGDGSALVELQYEHLALEGIAERAFDELTEEVAYRLAPRVGPFPVEPAPENPEAMQQEAETIAAAQRGECITEQEYLSGLDEANIIYAVSAPESPTAAATRAMSGACSCHWGEYGECPVHGLQDPVAAGLNRLAAETILERQRDELADALKQIAALGGNLPDDRLTSRTGPNDAATRGQMYVAARSMASTVLRNLGLAIFLLALLLPCLGFAQPLPQTLTGRARVVDGDTLEVQGQKIRLHGIDAPDVHHALRVARKGIK